MAEDQPATYKSTPIWIGLFLISWVALVFYSFSQLDLNLTLYNYPVVKDIISHIQYFGHYYRTYSTIVFIAISVLLLQSYLKLTVFRPFTLTHKQLIVTVAAACLIGIIAYPMFSYDIFNYLFNAKMVLVYHVNPHIQTANQFLSDPWTRFMHNIHTAAPYGYGWTGISLIPVFIGLPVFTLCFLFMKALVIGFFLLEGYLVYLLAKKLYPKQALQRTALFLLNPLILTETLIVGHNDSVMMAFALLSLFILIVPRVSPVVRWGGSLLALFVSISIKYATIVLVPLLFLRKRVDIFTWGGIALLLVLLTRPGQVHSWYLHWGIVLLLLSKHSWAVSFAILLSIGGLLRYFPYVYFGNWDYPVPLMRWVVLLLPLSLLLSKQVRSWFKRTHG